MGVRFARTWEKWGCVSTRSGLRFEGEKEQSHTLE